jgi:hypothetical protein
MLPSAIAKRIETLRRIVATRPVRWMLTGWVVLGAYDLALSQILPEWLGNRFPRLRDTVVMTGGWLSLQAWLLILAAIIVFGSIEYAHRRTGRAIASLRVPLGAVDTEAAPLGMLDHIVDGMNAFEDITSVNGEMTKEANSLSRFMKRYTLVLNFIGNPKLRRSISTRIANKIGKFAIKFNEWTDRMRISSEVVESSCTFIVNAAPLTSELEIQEFIKFRSVLLFSLNALDGLRVSTENSKISVGAMAGISRDLNVASRSYERSVSAFGIELTSFIDKVKRIDHLCQGKANGLGIPS